MAFHILAGYNTGMQTSDIRASHPNKRSGSGRLDGNFLSASIFQISLTLLLYVSLGISSSSAADVSLDREGKELGSAPISWETGRALFTKKDYLAAQSYFKRVETNFPESPFAEPAFFFGAECYFRSNQTREAHLAYKEFCNRFPKSKWIPEALLRRGEFLIKSGPPDQLGEIFSRLEEQRSENPVARDALGKLLRMTPGNFFAAIILTDRGKQLFERGDYTSARKYFARAVLSYPNDTDYPDDLFYQAECDRLLGQTAAAAAAYNELILKFPTHQQAVAAYDRLSSGQ